MMFAEKSDEVVRQYLNKYFGLLTGQIAFLPKGKSKDEFPIPIQQFTFMNALFFRQAFMEADKRNIMTPAEKAMGQELMDLIEQK